MGRICNVHWNAGNTYINYRAVGASSALQCCTWLITYTKLSNTDIPNPRFEYSVN